MENASIRKSVREHMLAMVGPVSKIDAGSLEKDHRARDGTEWGRIVWHSIRIQLILSV
jgi:hypothetical protein